MLLSSEVGGRLSRPSSASPTPRVTVEDLRAREEMQSGLECGSQLLTFWLCASGQVDTPRPPKPPSSGRQSESSNSQFIALSVFEIGSIAC